ncbi:MAG: type II glyceraldehyde-3-phosphate dehydrogenase [Halobaculum sp.]
MIRVGINGYGQIGKRIADAVAAMPDMEVAGVGKASPTHTADAARRRGYALHVPSDRQSAFAETDIEVAGSVEELIADSEIVVDATPAGVGAEYRSVYEAHDTPAIFQGGEAADVAPVSFTARANYADAVGERYVRIVSCNTTGLNRLFAPLLEEYGVERAMVTLVRCRGEHGVISADPVEPPSHHGPDALDVLPEIGELQTMGMKVPTIRHHFHTVNVALESAPTAADVRETLDAEPRLHLVPGGRDVTSGWDLQEFALDRGRDRMNLYENQIFDESLTVEGNQLYLFQSIHRESDVIPENVDAIRAVLGTADRAESLARTNEVLGIGSV